MKHSEWYIVRRRHVLSDTVQKLKNGLDVKKYIKVSFCRYFAVDKSGPRSEFLTFLMRNIAGNNFMGSFISDYLDRNLLELSRNSFYYVGLCIAMILVQGGQDPGFFAPSVVKTLK